MASVWGAAEIWVPDRGEQGSPRRALGAGDRRRWSSLVRQEDIGTVLSCLDMPQLHGAVILGPQGVGKTTLARNVARRLGGGTHVVQLFGGGAATDVPYAIFSVQLARLNAHQTESPGAVLAGLVELITNDAQGRPIVIVVDDLPGIDTLSMGVLMHLVLGEKAKLLVAARTAADFPEDLVWMVKDGLLAQQRLVPFTRAETRTLLARALGGPVAESVVSSLHTSSAGNPLVLQALVREYLGSGALEDNGGIWVLVGRLESGSTDILREIVRSRMGRETEEIRRNLEKFSLFQGVPLALAMDVLGPEAMAGMEERGFLSIGPDQRKTVSFAEPYFAEVVRNQLSAQQKADYFQELMGYMDLDAQAMTMQELLTFAAWVNDAKMVMNPDVAVAAAQAALHYFDPQLALACCAHVPAGHRLDVKAIQKRSRAHYLMANYTKAAGVLNDIDPLVVASLDVAGYASWAMDLTVALLWQPGEGPRVEAILESVALRIRQAPEEERAAAQKYYNLAWFEVQVHRGDCTGVEHELEIACKTTDDIEYRLNCASLLTVVRAATGRAADALELSSMIDEESAQHNVVLRMNDWHLYGRILALTWSGQWRTCEQVLKQAIDYSNASLQFRGGAMELSLGLVYAFAERHSLAADALLTAAAQLEARDTYKSLETVYSALAYVFARLDEHDQARKYLALAKDATGHTAWITRNLADHFQAKANHTLGDPTALDKLLALAGLDERAGRFGAAVAGLLPAVMAGSSEQYGRMGHAAAGCQGELAAIALLLAQADAEDAAQPALAAAGKARTLELASVERHAAGLAVELARNSGDSRLHREARLQLNAAGVAEGESLKDSLVPLTVREQQVARLAIRGMSNRTIAAQIGVSVRTVEGHVYQVFAKLGIASRAELERWSNL